MGKLEIVYAKQTAMVGQTRVQHGSYWPASDPIVKANPSLFTEDPREAMLSASEPLEDSPVETVTSRPGERRAQVHRG